MAPAWVRPVDGIVAGLRISSRSNDAAEGAPMRNDTNFAVAALFAASITKRAAWPTAGGGSTVVGALTTSPRLTRARIVSVLREPPTAHAGRPWLPGCHSA